MPENQLPKRKRIRLDRSTYDGPGLRAMVTIATRDRRPVFMDETFTNGCVSVLHLTAEESSVSIPAFCFMPDHVHVLCRLNGGRNLIDFIRLYKGRTSRAATDYGIPRNFWQKSFHDHLLRQDEDEIKYLQYVLENPIRAGLAQYVDEHPFSGTFEYDVERLADLFP